MDIGSTGPADGVQRFFRPLRVAASGLSAQRTRMETIAENIANAEATRTAEGGPYQRKIAELRARPSPETGPPQLASLDLPPLPFQSPEPGGVDVAGVGADPTEGPLVYDPGHPDADENGYVRYPNVELTQETVDLMVSRRAYEANATVFQVLKSVLHRALSI